MPRPCPLFPRSRFWLLLPALVALALPIGSSIRAADADKKDVPFVKGMSWGWAGARGDYAAPEAADSMKQVADLGCDWVCIAFAAAMETPMTPHIKWGDANPRMVTDDEIRRAIKLARDNGMKVILKPVVNCDDATWRAWVKFFRPVTDEERARGVTGENDPWADEPVMRAGEVTDLAKWAQWWKEFDAFILHYAQLAADEKCEMLCLGCEMNSTESFVDQWRRLISQVREKYDGLVTYDVNHDREHDVAWWDAVDVISISAYYHVPPPPPLTEEQSVKYTTGTAEIVAKLRQMRDVLAGIHEKYDKPILFIEMGVTNVRGCARYPWAHVDAKAGHPLDELEQANYYQAMFDVFWDEPWFVGYCWWDWPARLYDAQDAATDRSFCIYGKQAGELVRQWYAKER